MTKAKILASLFLLGLSFPVVSAEKWLAIFTAKDGYEFKGQRKGETWSFRVPGHSISTKDDDGRMFANIDNTIVQVLTVPLSDFPKKDSLAHYRKYESDYLVGLGARIAPSNVCASMALAHQEWKVIAPGGVSSTYVTVSTATHILIIVVAQDKNAGVLVPSPKLAGICASLAV